MCIKDFRKEGTGIFYSTYCALYTNKMQQDTSEQMSKTEFEAVEHTDT